MAQRSESESRKLLGRLRDTMAEDAAGQARLDKITHLIADSMKTEVCSIYFLDEPRSIRLSTLVPSPLQGKILFAPAAATNFKPVPELLELPDAK